MKMVRNCKEKQDQFLYGLIAHGVINMKTPQDEGGGESRRDVVLGNLALALTWLTAGTLAGCPQLALPNGKLSHGRTVCPGPSVGIGPDAELCLLGQPGNGVGAAN